MEVLYERPTFLFIGGVFHVPAHFTPQIDALAQLGYLAMTIQPPEVEHTESKPDPEGKLKVIKAMLDDLIVRKGKQVCLVCHSGGGVPGCQAVRGLERSLRKKQGKAGGIISVVFLSAFTIPEDKSGIEVLGGSPPSWAEFVPEKGLMRPSAICGSIFFSGLSQEEQAKYGALLRPQEGISARLPVRNTCWDVDVQKVFIYTTKDAVAPYDVFTPLLESVMEGRKEQWTVLKIDSDHAPFLSMPDEFAKLLVGLVH